MSGHTPGPWIRFMCEGRTAAILPAGRSGDVAVFESVGEPDARLLAAAPDLLDACLHLCDNYMGHEAEEHSPLGKARAAIAKATGHQP